MKEKSNTVAGLLGLFLGAFGVHNFYLGRQGRAVAQLLITILSFGSLSPVTWIWGAIEGIILLVRGNNQNQHSNVSYSTQIQETNEYNQPISKIANFRQNLKTGREENNLEKIQQDIKDKRLELLQLNKEIDLANDTLDIQEVGFFQRQYKFSDSEKYKTTLSEIREQERDLVKSRKAAVIIQQMTLNNSFAQGRAMQNQLIKAVIRGFNGEADAILTKISVSNVDKKITVLEKAFEQLNKMYSRNMIRISHEYLGLKRQEMRLAAEYELQRQEEKDLLREQREQEREDKKLQAEIAEKRKQLEKDRAHYEQAISDLEEKLKNNPDDEQNIALLSEYENKLEEIKEISEDIDYREGHATAGYVYVISNVGSFGDNIYKIGVTRRLEPLERIRELSGASVPFKFDVHALIFSENAFALETELHQKFDSKKVNKINWRKEYFNVSLEEIKNELSKHPDLSIEFIDHPEAFEYRQSQIKSTVS